MKAREYLKQVEVLDREIKCKMNILSQLEESMHSISSPATTERVQSSGGTSKTDKLTCKAVDLNREIESDIDRLSDLKRDIILFSMIALTPAEYDFMFNYYIELQPLCNIAYERGKSTSWAFKIRKRVLKKVQSLLDEKEGNNKNSTKFH